MRDTTPAPAHVVESLQSKLGRSHILRFVTALLLAIITWGWVVQATDPISTMVYSEIEIAQGTLENDLVMVTNLPRGAITVEGPQSEAARINRSLLSLHLDTSSVTEPGEYRLPVIVEAPDTSNRVSVEPKTVLVQIDQITSRVIPIEIQQTEAETDTRVVNNITTDVSQVTVSGPSSAVDRVDSVILPVTLETQVSTFSSYFTPYAVDANDQRVSEVTVLPNQVMTRVELQSRGKIVNVIPTIIGEQADGYSIQTRSVLPTYVVVDGPQDVLDDLLFLNTEPVDISGASQSVSARVGLADLPDGVTVIEPTSGQVEVRVAIQDTSATSQTLSNLPVSAVNAPAGSTITIEPETVDISVQGSLMTISQMTTEDITVVVDLRGLGVGTHQLTPVVALPNNGVLSTGTNPETVTVTIDETPATPNPSPVGTPEAAAPATPTDTRRRRFR